MGSEWCKVGLICVEWALNRMGSGTGWFNVGMSGVEREGMVQSGA